MGLLGKLRYSVGIMLQYLENNDVWKLLALGVLNNAVFTVFSFFLCGCGYKHLRCYIRPGCLICHFSSFLVIQKTLEKYTYAGYVTLEL